MGTDGQGRDVLSRVLYGAQVLVPTVGLVSQLINSCIGTALGVSAGYIGGWWDDLVNGLTNVMLAIPSLVFALAIMAVLGPGLPSLLIALGLTNWSWTCRIARSSTLSLKNQGFVQAAKTAGFSDTNIMRTQILPNILGPVLVIATLGIGGAVLAEAALSFLGVGIRPPQPSWATCCPTRANWSVPPPGPRSSPASQFSPRSLASICLVTGCAICLIPI